MSIQKYVDFIAEQQKHKSLRDVRETKEQYTHEITVHSYGWPSEHKKLTNKTVEKIRRKGFNAKVHEYGSGAAKIHIGHPDGPGPVDKFISKSYDPDHKPGDSTYNI
jgi:peptide methionine sulfoxide reductase MsrB